MIKTSLDWPANWPQQPKQPNLRKSDEYSRPKSSHSNEEPARHRSGQPFWDTDRRELRLGNVVIKHFRWPAENQERILLAFQEEGWPDRIDDPIVPHNSICPKRRLHDTLKCLNRKQDNPLIKFRGDGTGMGVRLEFVNQD